MDQVYKLYDRQASPKISLKEYFQQYGELVKSSLCHGTSEDSEEKIFQLMDVPLPQGTISLIKHYCSIENLSLAIETANRKEEKKQEYANISEKVLDNASLETIKMLKTLSKEPIIKSRIQNGFPLKYDESSWPNNDSVTPYEEFLVYCRVYEPFESQSRFYKYKINNIPFLKLKSVISILGCQTLYDLREKIMCQSDLSIMVETSKYPNKKPQTMAKDVYKSGFFYIEDTFYNDISASTNVDYSAVILQWAETRQDLGPFKVATMDAQINSLCARFGFPWVYQHQGCCEHLIVLTDARLVTTNDALSLSAYPRIERLRPISGKNCIYCGLLNVHWVITEHNRIPHGISYFCNKCFISYNYVNGHKIGNFKAYHYPCIPSLLCKKPTGPKRHK